MKETRISRSNAFAVCGDSGTGKTTMAKVLASYLSDSVVLECDRYHKWERGDPHWEEFTHLDPEANELDLMNQDVQDLKLGRTIHRRDYDHWTGRFTKEKEIRPAKNIIACGLHTMRCPEDMYDVMIFMDTDHTLKVQWKIARDIQKRGYTLDEVRQQINDRLLDFSRFLEPLISEADLVVNFCSESGMSYVDSVKGLGRHLRIFVNERHKVDGIAQRFDGLGIDYSLSTQTIQPGFHQIDINQYKKIDKNYYYDYIVICVLHILEAKCNEN